MKIGIVLIATNCYVILAVRFIKRFMHFYKGSANITFYIFTDEDPHIYLPDNISNVIYIETHHNTWVEGTDSKFSSILSIEDKLINEDFVLYVDSDTNIDKEFTEEWFIGESVGGQHFDDQFGMRVIKAFERNPRSKAYVPYDTMLPQVYQYGAFFSFSTKKMIEFCKLMRSYQLADKEWGYEPGVNDESYINREFHFNPPEKIVLCKDFKFLISDKGGLPDTRRMDIDIRQYKKDLLKYKDSLIDIQNGIIIKE